MNFDNLSQNWVLFYALWSQYGHKKFVVSNKKEKVEIKIEIKKKTA